MLGLHRAFLPLTPPLRLAVSHGCGVSICYVVHGRAPDPAGTRTGILAAGGDRNLASRGFQHQFGYLCLARLGRHGLCRGLAGPFAHWGFGRVLGRTVEDLLDLGLAAGPHPPGIWIVLSVLPNHLNVQGFAHSADDRLSGRSGRNWFHQLVQHAGKLFGYLARCAAASLPARLFSAAARTARTGEARRTGNPRHQQRGRSGGGDYVDSDSLNYQRCLRSEVAGGGAYLLSFLVCQLVGAHLRAGAGFAQRPGKIPTYVFLYSAVGGFELGTRRAPGAVAGAGGGWLGRHRSTAFQPGAVPDCAACPWL